MKKNNVAIKKNKAYLLPLLKENTLSINMAINSDIKINMDRFSNSSMDITTSATSAKSNTNKTIEYISILYAFINSIFASRTLKPNKIRQIIKLVRYAKKSFNLSE